MIVEQFLMKIYGCQEHIKVSTEVALWNPNGVLGGSGGGGRFSIATHCFEVN